MILKITLLVLLTVQIVYSQENAANSVSPSLLECYNNTNTLNREFRLPSSINVLIALIRKIESSPSRQNDRELAIELIHRFRQDGILRVNVASASPYVIPYTPLGAQSDKNKILLRTLIPGTAANFPNSTLTILERCSIHFMLSNSHDLQVRGDESHVCNRINRFQRRIRREVHDSEVFEPGNSYVGRKGNLEEEESDPNKDIDMNIQKSDLPRKNINIDFSDCPIENGVVYTKWGAVQAGNVIAGVAAGRETQIITERYYKIDSKFAATLAGDLAEVSLHQGAKGKQEFSIGGRGGWNGTQIPRWYFLEKSSDVEMTDAEIRGSLDGLIIAKNMEAWKNKARSLKLSQVLDMYYSSRGVFSQKYRACNRQKLYYEMAPEEELVSQTIGFSFLLDNEAKLLGTIIDSKGIENNGQNAVKQLNSYISSVQDLSCEVDSDTIQRVNADLVIVLDTDFIFDVVQRALAHLLDNIDVNPFETTYMIINAKTGEIMLNSSNTILDFYEAYNSTVHSNAPTQVDISKSLNTVENIFKSKIDIEINNKTARGKSTVVLFVLYNILNSNDKMAAISKKDNIKRYLPDLKFLVLGRSAKETYTDFVDTNNDAFDLGSSLDGTTISQSVNPLIERFKEIPKRIINPKCGSSLQYEGEPVVESFEQFIEPNSVNYYRVSPNYLYGETEKVFKFQKIGQGDLSVCFSRQIERPIMNNKTMGDVKCEQITSNMVTVSVTDPCNGYDTVTSCPPLYISVSSTIVGTESNNVQCAESGCRFPDNAKYVITVEKLTCYSSSVQPLAHVMMLLAAVVVIKFLSF
ncbi:hypothetical protein FQR65_LT01601 [Abscondita terminalis]|nr:hypothetical protein FQR65_LT01601 [Abscondita terminalis]